MSEAIRKLKKYEREGFEYCQVYVEEECYRDSQTGESGARKIIHIVMQRSDL